MPPPDTPFGIPPDQQDVQQGTVRRLLVTVLGRGGAQGVQLAGLIILARILAPEDFGLIAMVMAAIGVANIFKDLGLSAATIRAPSITRGQVSSLFWINLLFGGLMTLLASLVAPLLAGLYADPRIEELTRVLAWTFFLGGIGTQHVALMRRQLLFGRLAWLTMLSTLAGQLCAVLLAWQGYGYWSLAVGLLLTSGTNTLLAWCFHHWLPGRPVFDKALREMISFGGYMVIFVLLGYLALHAQNIMIGWMWGASMVGLYSRAFFLFTMLVNYILEPLNLIAPAGLSPLQDQPAAYRAYYLDLLNLMVLITAPIGCLCVVLAQDIIVVLLGAQWMEAATVLMLLGLGAIPQVICASSGWLYMSHGNSKAMMQWGIGGWSALLLIMLVGLPYGINGVASAYAIGMLVLIYPCMRLAFSRTDLKFLDLFVTLGPILIAAALSSLAVFMALSWWQGPAILRLVFGVSLFAVIYLAVLVFAFGQGERLRSLLSQLRRQQNPSAPA